MRATKHHPNARQQSVDKHHVAKRKAATSVRAEPSTQTKRGTTGIDQRIYDSVFTAIMGQRLPPGTKLTEASLCELFNVSRTIVRKALQRLGHEHIIELRPNRGATVASPTPQETREIFAARRAIESIIVPLVVERASKAQMSRLRRHIKDERDALRGADRSAWIRLTGEFHLALAEVAGNRVLSRFLSELVSRCSLIIALYDAPNGLPCADGEHGQLLDIIAARDVGKAVKMMDRHLRSIEQRLRLEGERDEINLAEILTWA